MTLEEKKQEVIEDFSVYDEWLDKYEYLIELGKTLEAYPEEEKTEDKLIKGCQSRVWLDYELKDGKLFFRADSDAIITKGIISLLLSVYSGRTPSEIAADDFDFVEKIGLKENLSPTRANGLVSMIDTIKWIANDAAAKEQMAGQAGHDENTQAGHDEKGVLSAEDVAALQPLYADVILALILDKMGIAARSGQMCAEPLMDHFGVTGMLRVSFAPYNTMEEADYFVKSLSKAISMLI